MKKKFLMLIILVAFACPSFGAKEKQKFEQPEEWLNISNEANVLYAQNEIQQAQNLFLSIPDDQRSAQNWLLIGNILQDQGKLSEAQFMYKKAIQTDEKYYKAYYNLANTYLQEGKVNMAIEEYKKAIKIKPEYSYAHYNLACAYIELGKFSKAKYELYNAVDLRNTIPDFHYNLAYVLKKLNKEKEAKVYLEHYNKLKDQGNNF